MYGRDCGVITLNIHRFEDTLLGDFRSKEDRISGARYFLLIAVAASVLCKVAAFNSLFSGHYTTTSISCCSPTLKTRL